MSVVVSIKADGSSVPKGRPMCSWTNAPTCCGKARSCRSPRRCKQKVLDANEAMARQRCACLVLAYRECSRTISCEREEEAESSSTSSGWPA